MSSPMKNSGIAWIGQVPEHWTVAPVRSVLKEVTAKNIFGKETTALQFRYGTIVEKDNFDATEDEYVARTIRNYTLIYPGVLVLNGLNLNYDFVTKRVALSRLKGAITSAYMTITPIDTHVLMPEFVEYLFKSYDAKMAFHGMGEGVRKILNFNELKRQPIIYPTYTEQKRIVQVLDKKCAEIDTLSNSIQQQIDTLEQYKRAVITETVTKGLNLNTLMLPCAIDYIGKIPSHWKLTRLGYICQKLNRPFSENATPLICSNNGQIIERSDKSLGLVSDKKEAFQGVKSGDLLIHGMDTWHGAIAVSKLSGKCTTVVHVCDSTENKPFIAYYLQMLAFKKVYKAISNGVRENTSDFRSWDKAGKIYITLPSKEEQLSIADYLDNKCGKIDAIIQDKQQQLEKLEQYKKATIFEYVTGKKQVPEV